MALFTSDRHRGVVKRALPSLTPEAKSQGWSARWLWDFFFFGVGGGVWEALLCSTYH